jgi:predicted esterase
MHGSGGNRLEFVVEATWLAARGVVGLTIDSPDARHPGGVAIPPGVAGLRTMRNTIVQNIVDLRRAVDLLQARADVDPKRIAYVGFSAGANTGAILAGVEHRIRAYALASGGALPPARYAADAPRRLQGPIVRILTPVDALRYVGHAAPSALLFQDGRADRIVPRAALVALARAGSEPKTIRWYGAGHSLDKRAIHDRIRWLAGRLGVGGPVVRRALPGP